MTTLQPQTHHTALGILTNTITPMCKHTQTHTHTLVYTDKHKHTHAQTQTYTKHIYEHKCTHMHTCTQMNRCRSKQIQKNTHTNPHTNTHTHTYVHTFTHLSRGWMIPVHSGWWTSAAGSGDWRGQRKLEPPPAHRAARSCVTHTQQQDNQKKEKERRQGRQPRSEIKAKWVSFFMSVQCISKKDQKTFKCYQRKPERQPHAWH